MRKRGIQDSVANASCLQICIAGVEPGLALWIARMYIGFERQPRRSIYGTPIARTTLQPPRTRQTSCPFSENIVGVYVVNVVCVAERLDVHGRDTQRYVLRTIDELRIRRGWEAGRSYKMIAPQHKPMQRRLNGLACGMSSGRTGACSSHNGFEPTAVASVTEAVIALFTAVAVGSANDTMLCARCVVRIYEVLRVAVDVVRCIGSGIDKQGGSDDVERELCTLCRCVRALDEMYKEAPGLLDRSPPASALRLQIECLVQAAWPIDVALTDAQAVAAVHNESIDFAAQTAARRALSGAMMPWSLLSAVSGERGLRTGPPTQRRQVVELARLCDLRNGIRPHLGDASTSSGSSSISSSLASSLASSSAASLASGRSIAGGDDVLSEVEEEGVGWETMMTGST